MSLEDIDPSASTEPRVVEAVVKEIKNLGDNTKKNYDELRKNHEELKATVDEMSKSSDPLIESKIKKLTEDISIRQQALDEAAGKSSADFKDRIEKIEVALKRPGMSAGGNSGSELEKDVKAFAIAADAVKKQESGVAFDKEPSITVEDYINYRKAYEGYLRRYGGDPQNVQSEVERKALQVGVDPDGGYTVPTAMSNRVIKKIYETDPIRQLASVETITTGAIEWMVETDEAGYAWDGETLGETTITAETSTPGWKKKRIVAHSLSARPHATQILLEDSGINVENWLADKVAQKFARAEAAAFVTGDGIGKPRGCMTYSSGTSWGTVQQVNMGAAANLTADGFVKVKYALQEFYLNRGTWLMNRSTVQAAMLLKDGVGRYIWQPSQIAGDPMSMILGLPVRMSTTVAEVTTNSLSVVLADWREAYMIVDRLGITVQRDPYTAKPFVEFFTRKRVGGDVINYDAIKIGKVAA